MTWLERTQERAVEMRSPTILLAVLLVAGMGLSSGQRRQEEEDYDDVITAKSGEHVDNEAPDEEDGLFHPPEEKDMLKFDASDAIQSPSGQEEGAPQQKEEEELDEDTKLSRELFTSAEGLLNSSSFSSGGKKKAWEMMQRAAELGHAGAQTRVAWAKVAGTNFRQDLEEAKTVFEKLADEGDPEAQMGVGFMVRKREKMYASSTIITSFFTQPISLP